ncbi:Thioredoxin reductase [bioreactor metagenome]
MGSGYRKLGIPGEELYSGKGISWCATCDGFFYRGKDVAVVGGGDSAAEEATFLTRFADSVTVIHRRDQLRASKIMADRLLADPKIIPAWNSQIVGLAGSPNLEEITLRDTVTGQLRTIAVSGLFEAIGHDPRSALVAGQVDLDQAGYVKVDGDSTRTSVAGVFACGDLVDHTYRQAITAAGTGCRAALDAERYLDLLDDIALAEASSVGY